jgi:hypothetical protein
MRIATVAHALFAFALVLASVASAQSYRADIDGAQEAPPNGSSGTGLGCFSYDANTLMLNYEVTYSGLGSAEVAAHIHGPAPLGVNAAVIFPFALGPLKLGSFGPLTAAQLGDLNSGLLYVNIHSALIPGGEIRGQILVNPIPCTVAVEEQTWSVIKTLYQE